MAVIAVDFDNVLVNITTPLPGVREAMLSLLNKGHYILVHSANQRGPKWIQGILDANKIPHTGIWYGQGKPVADLYVDDKAHLFPYNGEWTAEEVERIATRLVDKDNRKWPDVIKHNLGVI